MKKIVRLRILTLRSIPMLRSKQILPKSFLLLLLSFLISGLLHAQSGNSRVPVKTGDSHPNLSKQAVNIPMKSGGSAGTSTTTATVQRAPISSASGGGGTKGSFTGTTTALSQGAAAASKSTPATLQSGKQGAGGSATQLPSAIPAGQQKDSPQKTVQ